MQKMEPDYHFHVADPAVIAPPNGNMIALRFQTVEPCEGGHRRSGKYIHIDLTQNFAMQLLAHLRQVQKVLGLPDLPPPEQIFVPPEKDRH